MIADERTLSQLMAAAQQMGETGIPGHRARTMAVTSGGVNIAPQPIENRLRADPIVNQAVVISFMAVGAVNYVFTQTVLATYPELSGVR